MNKTAVLKGTSKVGKEADSRLFKRLMVILTVNILLFLVFLLSLRLGSVKYTTEQIVQAVLSSENTTVRTVMMNIRLPRTIIAALVGANLAVAGALMQAVMRNPLADPGLTGVSSGAGLAAVTIMLAFPGLAGFVPVAAFFGGTAASFLVYLLAWKRGIDPIRIILSGVAVNAVLGGGISLLSLVYSDKIQGVLMWMNGSLGGKTWFQVRTLLPYSAVGLAAAFFCISSANALQMGDDVAKNLGVRVNVVRVLLCMCAAFLTGISVATVGLIGFIGLMVPHIARLLVGSDYRYMLPSSAFMGAVLLIFADTGARTLFSPVELPVGIIMAICGGPFFIYLLRKGGSYKV